MESNLLLLMQDIVFLIKRNLENSFYCESLDLFQPVFVKISREALIQNYSGDEIKEAIENLEGLFFSEVKCNKKLSTTALLRLITQVSFSESTIYFTTFQYYINKLYEVDFCLDRLVKNNN